MGARLADCAVYQSVATLRPWWMSWLGSSHSRFAALPTSALDCRTAPARESRWSGGATASDWQCACRACFSMGRNPFRVVWSPTATL